MEMKTNTKMTNMSFVSVNCPQYYHYDKLKLCLDFVEQYSDNFPELVFLQVPNGDIWCGRYYKYSCYIDGVHRLMDYYNLKPYFMVRFQFLGDANFSIRIFNEYAVEIQYPLLCNSSFSQYCTQVSDSVNVKFSELELEKLEIIAYFNTIQNFDRKYEIQINLQVTGSEDNVEIDSADICNKLGLSPDIYSVNIGFGLSNWKIELRWCNGKVYFEKGWKKFVTEAGLCHGDLCVFHFNKSLQYIKVAVFENNMLMKLSTNSRDKEQEKKFTCWKIITKPVLLSGEMEIPILLVAKFENTLKNKVIFQTDCCGEFTGQYSKEKHCLYNLQHILKAYTVYENCMMILYYNGNSTFKVEFFDPIGSQKHSFQTDGSEAEMDHISQYRNIAVSEF